MKFRILQDILSYLGENFSKELSSNATGTRIHQHIKKETGCYDPYYYQKKEGNEIALSLIPRIREILEEDNSLGVVESMISEEFKEILLSSPFVISKGMGNFEGLKKELVINKIDEFEEALKKYDKVLYLVDNTGEIVFDKFLLEKIREYDVDITVAVKERPILNDACMKEALEAGLDEVATLITTGSDSVGVVESMISEVGVVESMISEEFKEILLSSPFVISKGMGNFEGLTEMNLEGQDIFVLLCTKCSSISKELGLAEGSHILTTL